MNKKIKNIIIAVAFIAAIILMLALASVENKRKIYEKYGELAIRAETDEKSAYILAHIDEYPEKLLNYYNDDVDFVYNYPTYKDSYLNIEFTDEELNSADVPALYMYDNRWAYGEFDECYIKKDGCAVLSITMAYLYLTHNNDLDPYKIGKIAEKNGVIGTFGGITNEGIVKVCDEIGLNAVEHSFVEDGEKTIVVDPKDVAKAIADGHAVIAGVRGETFGAHAFIIRQINEDGSMLINDPNSSEKTNMTWNFYELEPEIYFFWEVSKK